jgi:hypothetical protein
MACLAFLIAQFLHSEIASFKKDPDKSESLEGFKENFLLDALLFIYVKLLCNAWSRLTGFPYLMKKIK